jgi:hypothetical protein
MFFTSKQIADSIKALTGVHPFHGITFLVCKKEKLPVGKTIEFVLDTKTDSFLRRHHRISPVSQWFFQPFKSVKNWVRPDYSAKGLQAINTQTFARAFLHERNTRVWGWASEYVSVLASKLPKKKKIPAFHLAVWLYRDKDWPQDSLPENIVKFFTEDFHITADEASTLFDMSSPPFPTHIFQASKVSWDELQSHLPQAPDSEPEQGGILAYLEVRGLGPGERFVLEPANRLTLITGDNGLGKTFLLECAWWALTGIWADRPAFPNPGAHREKTEITFTIEGKHSQPERKTIAFDWQTLSWPQPKKRPTIPGLTVYARVDGSFAVWDPVKQITSSPDPIRNKSVFTSEEVWNGLQGRIEGLVRDWVRWQNNPSKSPFETFTKVLAHLSPPDLGRLEPGEPVRIPDDPRDIPTIRHPYGVIPIVYSSAGVRRIITLAYLIVWAWTEHVVAAELVRSEPQRRMVVLVDEMEAHLHPRWQRAVLPALMSIAEMLAVELEAQYIVATHSPLVMASAEAIFNSETDSLVHLDLAGSGEVSLSEIDFIKFGDVSSWLTSPVFELRHARSKEAETAIEEAKALQLQVNPSIEKVREVSSRLVKYLAQDDKFWPRWMYFAEKFGVQL